MFTIYSKPNCMYCDRAKSVFKLNNYQFKEVNLDVGQEKDPTAEYITVDDLKAKIPTAKTMPQIYHNDVYVGGFSELQNFVKTLEVK